MNIYPIAVINDFYENPDAIRKFALAQKYTFRHEEHGLDYVSADFYPIFAGIGSFRL